MMEKKVKEKKKINLEEIASLTKNLFHAHYAGNPEQWFSYLCSDSIYLGTGEPMLFGDNAIQKHFKGFEDKAVNIVEEEYFPVLLGPQAAQVYGQIIVENQKNLFRVMNRFTITYRLVGSEIKMIHQHNSYEYMQHDGNDTLNLDAKTMQFVRNLLLDRPARTRLALHSGTQTIFVDPDTILYVLGQRKHTDLVCVDRVIACNSSMGEMAKIFPDYFYQLHRSYLVNTRYITAIRRFEAELISGIRVPIPAATYQQAKRDLQNIILGLEIPIAE